MAFWESHLLVMTWDCPVYSWYKRCVDDSASFGHEVLHKKRRPIFLQAMPLEDEGCVQVNLAGASLHNTQEAVLVME